MSSDAWKDIQRWRCWSVEDNIVFEKCEDGDYRAVWMRASEVDTARAADAAYIERLQEVLTQFEAHYPMGINPYLDEAACDARAILKERP